MRRREGLGAAQVGGREKVGAVQVRGIVGVEVAQVRGGEEWGAAQVRGGEGVGNSVGERAGVRSTCQKHKLTVRIRTRDRHMGTRLSLSVLVAAVSAPLTSVALVGPQALRLPGSQAPRLFLRRLKQAVRLWPCDAVDWCTTTAGPANQQLVCTCAVIDARILCLPHMPFPTLAMLPPLLSLSSSPPPLHPFP